MTHEEIEELAESGKRWRAHDGSSEEPKEIRHYSTIVVVYKDGYSHRYPPIKYASDLSPKWCDVVGWRYD